MKVMARYALSLWPRIQPSQALYFSLAAPPVGLVEPEAPVTAQTLTPTLTQHPIDGQEDKV